jgi:hypothetical protein
MSCNLSEMIEDEDERLGESTANLDLQSKKKLPVGTRKL